MSKANIKLESKTVKILKAMTGMGTGQKAVEVVLDEYLAQKTRKNIVKLIREIKFKPGYNPRKLRQADR